MSENCHVTIAFDHLVRVDHVAGKRTRVAAPCFDVRSLPFERRLVEDVEMMVFCHQLGQSVNVSTIDCVDEADNGCDGGQGSLSTTAHSARSGRLSASVQGR